MKILAVMSEPISARQLRDALPDAVEPQDAEVMVLAPALQENPIKFWMSDADDAIERAEQVWRQTVDALGDAGVPASGDVGEADPSQAIEDALRTFSAERIVLFTHRIGEQRYREEIDEHELEERFGIPVQRAAPPSS